MPPKRLDDYVVGATSLSSPYPMSKFVNYSRCSADFNHFLGKVDSINEPYTYRQACDNPLWQAAMNKEIKALEENHTWELTTLPQNKTLVDCR